MDTLRAMRLLTAVVLAAALALSACGSDEAASPSVDSYAGSEPTKTQTTEPKTATEIGEAIKAEIPEISRVVTITEDNDPNDKIGRPGGYVDGAVLFDSRAEPTDKEPGVDQGAFLEVWPDEAASTDRSEFVQDALKSANGVLGTEYHYRHKGFLLRVTGELKPSQAKAYESVFNAQFR